MEPNSVLATYDFKRKPNSEKFKKNVIKHEFKPIIIKKDRLVLDVVKDYEIISEKELNSRIDRNRNKLSSSK